MTKIIMNPADIKVITDIIAEKNITGNFELVFENTSGIGYTIDLVYCTKSFDNSTKVSIPVCGVETWQLYFYSFLVYNYIMNIKHHPNFDIDKACKLYSERDGVDITYVCTTDLGESDRPVDVFFRSTPHPQFGNRYFGLFRRNGSLFICNADKVEEYDFGVVENDDGELEYSQSHHDYKQFKNGNMIDGGRAYIRASVQHAIYRVVDGKMV